MSFSPNMLYFYAIWDFTHMFITNIIYLPFHVSFCLYVIFDKFYQHPLALWPFSIINVSSMDFSYIIHETTCQPHSHFHVHGNPMSQSDLAHHQQHSFVGSFSKIITHSWKLAHTSMSMGTARHKVIQRTISNTLLLGR